MVHAYVVTALNPKSIVFFVAFLPQFILPEKPLRPQLDVLGGTFVVLAVTNAALYALLAGGLRERLTGAGIQRTLDRLGGGVLIGAGLMTAAMRRS
ncbi:MAG: LysE family transporter [Deltaproteobacteria bacterium]|nr:LysE family transporter [Deltaproteobacteria bacterium]